MTWRNTYRDKWIAPEQATGLAQGGQTVGIGFLAGEPRGGFSVPHLKVNFGAATMDFTE